MGVEAGRVGAAAFCAIAVSFGPARAGYGLFLPQFRDEFGLSIQLSGLVARDSPFAGKIGAALTLANTVPDHLQATGGTTILMQVSRTLNNEDFEKIDLTARHYPFVASGV